jgi:hypothetical protein
MLVIGSVRAAVRAGIQHATKEASVNKVIADAYTRGSNGAMNAPAIPTTSPMITGLNWAPRAILGWPHHPSDGGDQRLPLCFFPASVKR